MPLNPTHTALAIDWLDATKTFSTDLKSVVLLAVIPALCVVFIAVVGFKTRAAGPTLAAVLLAGLVWGGAASLGVFKATTEDTITNYTQTTTIKGDQ